MKYNITPVAKPRMNEAGLTNQVRDILRACQIWHWKNWSGPMTYPKGISDILGIHEGKFLAIELKIPGWKPPAPGMKAYKHFKEQEDFIFHVNENGGIGFFAQSAEEVIEKLELKVRLFPLFGRWK